MKDSKGLSLMELLVGITVASIAGLILIHLMVSSNNIFFNQTIQVQQGLSLNQTTDEITDLLRASAGVAAQYPVTGAAQYTTDSDTIVLKLPALSENGQIIDSVFDYAVVAPDPSNSKILRKIVFVDNQSARNSENRVLSTSLSTLVFSYLDSGDNAVSPTQAVRISFTINLSSSSGINDSQNSASGIVNLKNI